MGIGSGFDAGVRQLNDPYRCRDLDDPERIINRDNSLWKREVDWADNHGITTMRCPCAKCAGGGRPLLLATVQAHLLVNQRSPMFRVWKGLGEPHDSDEEWGAAAKIQAHMPAKVMDDGVQVAQMLDDLFVPRDVENLVAEVARTNTGDAKAPAVEVVGTNAGPRVDGINIVNMAQQAFSIMEQLEAIPESMPKQSDLPLDDDGAGANNPEQPEAPTADQDDFSDEANALREACESLYTGAQSTKLVATMLLMNVCQVHGVSNKFVDELLALLHLHLLPRDNCLPSSMYRAKVLTSKVGLRYNNIHACSNGCILFRKQYERMQECPKCGAPRYRVVGRSQVPVKVVRHFPLAARLLRMYRAPAIAELMTWHNKNQSTDGKVRHAPDSKAWAHINATWPEFAANPRNIRLGLATDGFNPFGEKSSSWSTWPVMFFNYNLPPWLVTKRFFVILSLIIPGPESVKVANFDVYLEPVIEELELWKGVAGFDILQPPGCRAFVLKAMLMWTIHDFPGYGLVFGCQHQGYKACPPCGSSTVSTWSKELGKAVFEGSRRWLQRDHPYRTYPNAAHFIGAEELRMKPRTTIGADTLRRARRTEKWLARGNVLGSRGCPSKETGLKRQSALFRLPYLETVLNV